MMPANRPHAPSVKAAALAATELPGLPAKAPHLNLLVQVARTGAGRRLLTIASRKLAGWKESKMGWEMTVEGGAGPMGAGAPGG